MKVLDCPPPRSRLHYPSIPLNTAYWALWNDEAARYPYLQRSDGDRQHGPGQVWALIV